MGEACTIHCAGKPVEAQVRMGRGDNIKMHFEVVEWESLKWIQIASDRVQWRDAVNIVMKPRISCKARAVLNS
jgi:hypothetical protein